MEEKGLILPSINESGQYVVQIKEENIETGGHYQAKSFDLIVPASTGWYSLDFSFPVPIGLMAARAKIIESMNGDEIQCLVAPDTVIGAITSDVSVDDTVINVSQSVIDNTSIGFFVDIYDGTNHDDLQRIVSIDSDNLQITVAQAATQSFLASAPTYVRQTLKYVPNLTLVTGFNLCLGSVKIGSSYVPANTTMRLSYNNISGTAKTFSFIFEYLY